MPSHGDACPKCRKGGVMDPKQVSEVDQALKLFSSTTPGFLWTFFSNCKEEGFTESQAMALTMKELELLMSSRGQS